MSRQRVKCCARVLRRGEVSASRQREEKSRSANRLCWRYAEHVVQHVIASEVYSIVMLREVHVVVIMITRYYLRRHVDGV